MTTLKTGINRHLPEPQSRRRFAPRRAAQDWVPDPIEAPETFWAKHKVGMFACGAGILVSLIVLGVLGLWFFDASLYHTMDAASGALIAAALHVGVLGASLSLPLKWWVEHRRVRRALEADTPTAALLT